MFYNLCVAFCQTLTVVQKNFAMRIYKIIDFLVLCQLCFTGLAAVDPDISILHTFNLTSALSGTPSQSLG